MAELIHYLMLLSVITLMSYATSDVTVQNTKCEMACSLKYDQNAEEVGYCCRGCRLMRLSDFVIYDPQSRNGRDLLQTCSNSCATAYSGQAAASSVCQSGCKLELPAVEYRLHQLQTFYDEQAKYMQMFDVINKLMSCHMQSFMSAPRQPDRSGDRYFRARVMFVSTDGRSVSSVSVSRGSDAGVKTERRVVVDDGRRPTGQVLEGKSRLYAHTIRSDPAVVLFFLFGLVLLIGLSVSLCYPPQRAAPPAKPQKLSIYGDGDFLSTLDEDDTLIDIKPRAQLFVPAPLPAKHAL